MELNEKDVKALKDLIIALEAAKIDTLTQRAVLGGEAPLLEERIEAVKKVLGWGGKDDAILSQLKGQIQKETKSEKTIGGKYEKIQKILKTTVTLLVGVAAGATGAIVISKTLLCSKEGAEKK